ncbi:MAG: hypothetical protein AAFQ75_05470, partial [Pseudomonadota bacterium]
MITISGIGGDPKTVSGSIAEAVGEAVSRVDRMDHDPVLRDAIARATVRIFAGAMMRRFALERAVIAEEVLGVGSEQWSPLSNPMAAGPVSRNAAPATMAAAPELAES